MSRGMSNRNAELGTRPSIDVPLVAALAGMPLVLVVAHVPSTLLLPAIAALAFAIAALTAAVGWTMRADRHAGIVTIWDFAGACTFIGVAAGMFSEPLQVAQFFGAVTAVP